MTIVDRKQRGRYDPMQRARERLFSTGDSRPRSSIMARISSLENSEPPSDAEVGGDLRTAERVAYAAVLPPVESDIVGRITIVRSDDDYDVPNLGITDALGPYRPRTGRSVSPNHDAGIVARVASRRRGF
jgi:hypothetical protein